MTLDLCFWAENAVEAREQALRWAAAEPAVESMQTLSAKPTSIWGRWVVTVEVALRPRHEQISLGLSA